MIRSLLALMAGAAVLVAACGGAGATTVPATASTPAGTALPTSTNTATAGAPISRIEVKLTDTLRIEPAEMTVPAGVPITFVVTNVGVLEHEFFLGDEAAQQAHGEEMEMLGGMPHDHPDGIGVQPGQTRELTYTFAQPGETLAGCHVQGHYVGGMKAVIRIE